MILNFDSSFLTAPWPKLPPWPSMIVPVRPGRPASRLLADHPPCKQSGPPREPDSAPRLSGSPVQTPSEASPSRSTQRDEVGDLSLAVSGREPRRLWETRLSEARITETALYESRKAAGCYRLRETRPGEARLRGTRVRSSPRHENPGDSGRLGKARIAETTPSESPTAAGCPANSASGQVGSPRSAIRRRP